jgi:hypothetical protein
MVHNGSITNAVTLNPRTTAVQPYAAVLVTPGHYTNVTPRIDCQLTENNTLLFRHGITHADVQDSGIDRVQAADTILIGHAVSEMPMDADSGKIIGPPFPIGARVDTTVLDPETGIAACSTGDGAIHVFHEDSPDKINAIETMKTEYGAKTMAFDPKTHNLLVDTSDFTMPAAGGRPTAIRGTFRLLVYGR